jgi:hypothetical protein
VAAPTAPAGADLLLGGAGVLAFASVAIALAGLAPAYQYGASDHPLATDPWVLWYTLIMGALVAGAGALVLSPSRRLVGAGLLVGLVPAATASLLTIGSLGMHVGGLGPGYELLFSANATLVLGACAVVPYLRRQGVRIAPPPVRDRYALAVVAAGAAGALALIVDLVDVSGNGSEVVFPDFWVLAMAFVAPALAAAAAPRPFAAAVLVAWVGSCLAILVDDVLQRIAIGWSVGPIVPFGAALVLLAAAAVPFATAGRRGSG